MPVSVALPCKFDVFWQIHADSEAIIIVAMQELLVYFLCSERVTLTRWLDITYESDKCLDTRY